MFNFIMWLLKIRLLIYTHVDEAYWPILFLVFPAPHLYNVIQSSIMGLMNHINIGIGTMCAHTHRYFIVINMLSMYIGWCQSLVNNMV